MNNLPFGLVSIIVAITIAFLLLGMLFKGIEVKEKKKYYYRRKNFFLSKAENEFYKVLVETAGQDYFIFAQVHLPTIVDHTIRGQSWRASLAHIDRKSVDLVLCDKTYISPKLAIELDDRSHEREDRKARDQEVERILDQAGVPLLRIQNRGNFDTGNIASRIKAVLK